MLEVVRHTARAGVHPVDRRRGIRAVEDVDALLRAGADKVSVNTAAIARPDLLAEMARQFGSQCIVLSVDARLVPAGSAPTASGWEVTTTAAAGTGIDAIEWASAEPNSASGRSCSIRWTPTAPRRDSTCRCRAVRAAVSVPVIASGGAGAVGDFARRPCVPEPMRCWPPASSFPRTDHRW